MDQIGQSIYYATVYTISISSFGSTSSLPNGHVIDFEFAVLKEETDATIYENSLAFE